MLRDRFPGPPRWSTLAPRLLAACSVLATSACATATASHSDSLAGVTASATGSPAVASAVSIPAGRSGLAAVWIGNQGRLELIDGQGGVVASVASWTKRRASFRDPPFGSALGSRDSDLMPYFSSSRDRLYFLNGDADVWVVSPGGGSRVIKRLPVGHLEHAGFAVSPDDKTIAVAIIDYAVTPHTLRVYTEDLADGAGHSEVLSSTRRFEWPVGFLGTNLLMAVGPTSAQSGSRDPYGAQFGYDLLTAHGSRVRSFCAPPPSSNGAGTSYGTASGPLTREGAICLKPQGNVLESWTGTSTPLPDGLCGAMVAVAYSPDQQLVMCVDQPSPIAATYHLRVVATDGRELAHSLIAAGGGGPYDWVDDGHLIIDRNLLDVAHDTVTPLPATSQLVAVVPGDMY